MRIVLGSLLMLCSTAWAALPAAVDGQPLPSLAPVLKEVTPSVVNVYTQTRVRVRSPLLDDPIFRRFFNVPHVPRERVSQSLGSGIEGTAGHRAGLLAGDIITAAYRVRIRSLKDLSDALQGLSGPVVLQINRNGQSYVTRIE